MKHNNFKDKLRFAFYCVIYPNKCGGTQSWRTRTACYDAGASALHRRSAQQQLNPIKLVLRACVWLRGRRWRSRDCIYPLPYFAEVCSHSQSLIQSNLPYNYRKSSLVCGGASMGVLRALWVFVQKVCRWSRRVHAPPFSCGRMKRQLQARCSGK